VAAVHTRAIGDRSGSFNGVGPISLFLDDDSPESGRGGPPNRGKSSSLAASNSQPVSAKPAVREHAVRDRELLLPACRPWAQDTEKAAIPATAGPEAVTRAD
jgi:hypothetical protein